MNEKLK